MPATVTLAPLAVQGFSATVLGTSNQSVVWQIQGSACSAPGACGAIDVNGIYTAPGAPPAPNALTIAALSADDPSQSGLANVTITTAVAPPTTAEIDLSVPGLAPSPPATNPCALAGNPLPWQRAASGVAAADICLFSASGLDTSMAYTVTGPGDVAVIAKQPAGLGIIHLTLQISAVAIPGARTLFIQNTNLDRTAATGALEVQ